MYKMPGAGVGTAGGSVGALASTGADVGWWLAFGALLIVLGAVAVIASYRRKKRLARSAA
ncbi:LPXTG cell wall anchor domain-containing protein [Saccharomonospora sp. NPDC046836]|uniref:LPXTG cell wall anchor domain-containing protein n=1 Tax=Saccharomonospora sp. NPDC046836 TaxID=3156921 RepID=UPI00340B26B2